MAKRTTKHALLLSVLSLIVCASMLIGSTFAWFTDSVTSSNNKIQAGNLAIDLMLYDADTDTWNSIKGSSAPIFTHQNWEPGYIDAKLLRVENHGSLALKWVAQFASEHSLSILADVIDVYVLPGADTMPTRDLTGYSKVGTLRDFVSTIGQTTYGTLLPNDNAVGGSDEAYLGIALKMREEAGNIYQELDLGGNFDIRIFATQLTYEKDSFGDDYDIDAEYDGIGTGAVAIDQNNLQAAYDINVFNTNSDNPNEKLGTVNVPKDAIANDAKEIVINIAASQYDANISVPTGHETKAFDVTVTGLTDSNTTPLTVQIQVGAGYDPAVVKVYHYDTLIPSTYDPHSGYITFQSAEFSPFTVVYDAKSEYVAPEVDDTTELPVAIVTEYTPSEPIVWGDYGQWSPTEGLEANLEAIYKFACEDTPEEAAASPYANWYCDFYVKLDRDLAENQIFLGGNYGDFGWIGFHNGEVTLPANEELPLLGSVTNTPWIYADIASFVGEFICGVGDVNDALSGATFTVMLRLTNPEDAADYKDVATINYTFE